VENVEKERKPVEVKPKIADTNTSLRRSLPEPRGSIRESNTCIRRLEDEDSVIAETMPQRGLAPSKFGREPASLLKLTLTLIAALSGALTTAVLVTILYVYTLPLALPMILACIVEALNLVLIIMLWMVVPHEH